MIAKFGFNKPEHPSVVWCKKHFDILNRLGVTHECDEQADRRTDRLIDNMLPGMLGYSFFAQPKSYSQARLKRCNSHDCWRDQNPRSGIGDIHWGGTHIPNL